MDIVSIFGEPKVRCVFRTVIGSPIRMFFQVQQLVRSMQSFSADEDL